MFFLTYVKTGDDHHVLLTVGNCNALKIKGLERGKKTKNAASTTQHFG